MCAFCCVNVVLDTDAGASSSDWNGRYFGEQVVQEAKDGADGSGGRTTKKLATGKLQVGSRTTGRL